MSSLPNDFGEIVENRILGIHQPLNISFHSLFAALILFFTGQCYVVAQTVVMQDATTVNLCSGTFYDSGGNAGNYSDSEDMTMTICPTGGAGSGPMTEVEFTLWDVEAGTNDSLSIYDGTTITTLLVAGNGANSLFSTTVTATDASGCLTFKWISNGTVNAPGWSAVIRTGPNAGADGSLSICSNGSSTPLFALLGGDPDLGGTWTGPSNAAHSGNYNPLVDASGIYTYTVAGPAPCADATAIITVTETTAPNAGTSNAGTYCDTDGSINLIALLGGTPDLAGTWTDPSSAIHSGIFNPAADGPGDYDYTVSGIAPCVNVQSTITIALNAQPDAGEDGSSDACDDQAPFSMYGLLGGSPDNGGAWLDPVYAVHSATFTPGTDAPGEYTYVVYATAPCVNDSAVVQVEVNAAPDAGTNGNVTFCSTDASVDLFTILTGNPDAGGTWSAPSPGIFDGTYIPGTSEVGIYTYTVTGIAPCTDDQATVTVSEHEPPIPGNDANIAVCTSDASFGLIDQLGGTPDNGGIWRDPNGAVHANTFMPSTDIEGTYTYMVSGTAPCADDSATVEIVINLAPEAGQSTSISLCSTDATVDLIDLLGGIPDAGGTWEHDINGAHGNQFDPSTDDDGIYTYTVAGIAPCADATATVNITVNTAPIAGTGNTLEICSSDGAVNLFTLLGGSPMPGGTWMDSDSDPHSGTYNPTADDDGDYIYTVLGIAPCVNATSTITVVEDQAPDAGSNSTIAVCSNEPVIDLRSELNGTPDLGGIWAGPGGVHTGSFDPAVDDGGNYTYTVAGAGACSDANATVLVNLQTAPKAGDDAIVSFCNLDGSVQLIDLLGGAPDQNGSWLDPNDVAFGNTFNPGTNSSGIYTYVVNGSGPCENDSAIVDITVEPAPDAGSNAQLTICSNDPSVDLFTLLGGTPDGGGTWNGPGGAHNGIYNPSTDDEGTYTYTVSGNAPCIDDEATVEITENLQPNAGTDGSVSVCSNDPAMILLTHLSGTISHLNGTWRDPVGAVHDGILDPDSDPSGDYTYLIQGAAPCTPDSSVVAVTITNAPDPGIDGGLTTCPDVLEVDLFDGLGGTYDVGGSWNDNDNTGALSGNLFSPFGLPADDYHFTYTVQGQVPCGDEEATVMVTIVPQLDAGIDGAAQVCDTETAFNLFDVLNGTPQAGGTWEDIDGSGGLSGQELDASIPIPNIYNFRYVLVGSVGCSNDTAMVSIAIIEGPDAGEDATREVCSTGGVFNMFNELGGSPETGGLWRDENGAVHSNNYTPANDEPGDYTYTVFGSGPCDSIFATLTVEEAIGPYAGISNDTTRCSTGGVIDLFDLLGGNPDPNGSWTYNNIDHSGTFVPGIDVDGAYLYTVEGEAPCADDITTVTVSTNEAPFAGNSTSENICSNSGQVVLITLLGGTPDGGGTWEGPDGAHNGVYDPNIDTSGVYTYTVTGDFPCADATASVTIFEIGDPNAGVGDDVQLCSNSGSVDLFQLLTGDPDLSGTWTDPDGAAHTGTFIPSQDEEGDYTYHVDGLPPCLSDSSIITVTIIDAPNPGASTQNIICDNSPPFSLIDLLGGNPDLGGSWSFSGASHNGIFLPGNDDEGVYTYTVQGSVVCDPDSSTVTIIVNEEVYAGQNGSATFCSSDGSTNLFPFLNNNPDAGGFWLAPDTTAHNGIFNPSSSLTGSYFYVVQGVAPCTNDTATVQVQVNQEPDAGNNGTVTVCSDNLPFNLFDHLGGAPDAGGDWYDQDTIPHSGTFIPGVDEPGLYAYVVTGQAPCPVVFATVNVFVNPIVSAGTGVDIEVCSSDDSFELIDILGDNPDQGGIWTLNGVEHSDRFEPGSHPSGDYVYTVAGIAPCSSDSAVVSILVQPAPNAGGNSSFPVCSDQNEFDMFFQLDGTPDIDGFWLNPVFASHTGIFMPGVDISGPYTYVVQGNSPCVNDSATVLVTNVSPPNAGVSGVLTTCLDDPDIDLFDGLTSSPDMNGIWEDLDNTGQLGGSTLDATGLPIDDYEFRYIVPGNGPCAADTAYVTVSLTQQLDAGEDGILNACDNEHDVDLFAGLGGSPQIGGGWADENAITIIDGLVDAADYGVGTFTFTYIIVGSGACVSDTAYIDMNIVEGPNAGTVSSEDICTDDQVLDMFTALSGNPDTGGDWFDNSFSPRSSSFNPAVDMGGTYYYVVEAQGLCLNDTNSLSIDLFTAPNAGTDTTITFCATDNPVQLFDLLGGDPDQGGEWTFINVFHAGSFDPSIDPTGVFIYTVEGNGACGDAVASVTISVTQPPFAGNDEASLVCSTDQPFDMITVLGGIPDPGGFWLDTLLDAHGNEFDPGVDPSGVYNYVVEGGVCANDTALAYIDVIEPPNAGIGVSIDTCETATILDLFNGISGPFEYGGSWAEVNTVGALAGSIFDPSNPGPGSYTFTYTVNGQGNCADDQTTVTVNVAEGPNAGIGDTLDVCMSNCAFDLFDALNGNPQTDGDWSDGLGTGALDGNILNTCLLPPGSYPFAYTVNSPGCGNVTTTVLITAVPGPDAGEDGQILVCSTDASTLLSSALGGTPDNGGYWVNPLGQAHGEDLDPATDNSGDYLYIVESTSVCGNDTSIVAVIVNNPPDPGLDAFVEVCDTLSALDLFQELGGAPDNWGIFNDDNGSGALNGNIFNPSAVGEGQFNFTYNIDSEGCTALSSVVTVLVHGSVTPFNIIEACDERYRMYTVSFSIQGGDGTTYEVYGVDGEYIDGTPPMFVSDPIPHHEVYSITVEDQYACNVALIEGDSPCHFNDDVMVPESFSPDNDGINERFLIPGIEAYPFNTMLIFNRWGNEVFSASSYDNEDNNWDGRSQKAIMGEELPEGTYFYVLDLNNGKEALSGYVYLNR